MSESSTSHSDAPSDTRPSIDQTVSDLLGPIIETTGAELIDVEWAAGTLRITVDESSSESGRITADRLAELNRLVSPILDQHDPVPGKYLLEVSSPGVERPLRRGEHFARAVGEDVIVKLVPGVDPRRLRGELVAFDNDELDIAVVEVDGVELADPERHNVSLDDVAKARTYFDWGPAPKAGQKAGNKKRTNNSGKKPSRNTGPKAGRGTGKKAGKNSSKGAGKKPGKNAGQKVGKTRGNQ